MASLDQFLQDLDDLDDEQAGGGDEEAPEEDEMEDEDEDIDMMGEDVEPKSASGLLASGRLTEVIERIEDLMVQAENGGQTDPEAEYSAIIACNEMVIEADNEVQAIAKSIKDDYAKRFPELESLIPNPLDYARVVLKLGNETDLTQVDLTGILPSASIMVVTVTASTTAGTALPEAALQKVQDACEQVLTLSDNKQKMLAFVESRMASVAPNLSAIVGTQVAAKLIGAAGGLDKLAALPSTVLQVLGSKKKALGGMASNTGLEVKHAGFIQRADLIQNTPPQLRTKVLRLVAGKCTLACRADSYGDSKGGEIGEKFKEEIEQKAIKMQEPPPPKDVKALPIPPEASGKRRGGRRLRKMKERFGMTQMRQLTNRVQFGQEEDTTSDGLLGVGMLSAGQRGGKMRVSAKEQKLQAEKNKKRQNSSSGATNGLASSLAFTPVQGIELVNPTANKDSKEGTETYFTKTAAFFKNSF
jgi:U4/U6 small nuclear ribonucleoprotein PRP31